MRPDQVVMIGAFPPPVGGAAKVNGIIFDALRAAGIAVAKVDVSAATLSHRRTMMFHAQRISRNIWAVAKALRLGAKDALLYTVPNGGAGAWYTLAHVRASGRFGKLVIHHHSCAYIDHQNRAIQMMTAFRRADAVHVFLTPGMAAAFQERYGDVAHVVASNARFVSEEAARQPLPRDVGPLRLGHLSNLCEDKGFFEVAEAYEALREAGIEAELMLAGPVLEPAVQDRLDDLRQKFSAKVRYYGPVSGEAKNAFYRELDLFLFPTQFRQEAAPIVIYESLAAGVPVLSTDRGRITEMLSDDQGAVCPTGQSFSAFALGHLRAHAWDGAAVERRASRIKSLMRDECEASREQYSRLLQLLGAGPTSTIGSS